MPTFNPAGGQLVADDLCSTFRSVDNSLHDAARLVSTFVEVCANSDLPPARAQKVLRAMSNSISRAVDMRADVIEAQRVLVTLKQNSNLDIYDFGCLMFPAAHADQTPGDQAQRQQTHA